MRPADTVTGKVASLKPSRTSRSSASSSTNGSSPPQVAATSQPIPPAGGSPPPTVLVGAAAAGAATDDSPVSRRRVFIQVTVAAVVVIVAVALAGVLAAQRLAEAQAITDAAKTTDLIAESLVQPVVTDGLLTGDPAAVAGIDAVVRDHVLSPSMVRVKVWDPSGRIVYSDQAVLIGRSFPLGQDERDALSDLQTRAEVSDLQAPENVYERDSGKLLEVYRPVWTPSGRLLLFETYFRYDQVTERSGQLWEGFAGVTLSSILLLVVLLIPILWRLLNRLNRSQRQRETLLQRAIDASTKERRRIAGTLHDGVVQDLAAASFAVSGSAERAAALGQPALAQDLRAAAGTVRASIGGLRSLLVDIYPPNLASTGLVPALGDLASRLRSRGLAVAVEVTDEPGLDLATQRLIYRVTQEILANVARHAAALNVTVRLTISSDGVVLDIADDGTGFDPTAAMARPADGHFGLRVLGDLAADAGAELTLATAPGAGTRWRLRLPR
jgi:two-component system NarL family sensor kinase